MDKKERLEKALQRIRQCRTQFYQAEQDTVAMLKEILECAGNKGVCVMPDGIDENTFIPVAERDPLKFSAIQYIRYWNGQLEVFVTEYRKTSHPDGWKLLSGGEWIPYDDAMADTWFILDQLEYNICESDGYAKD